MLIPHTPQTQTTETVLWGVKIGNPDAHEEVLYTCQGYTNLQELASKGEAWAAQNGYNRLRIAILDMTTKPKFS